jgi:hypothetical protein
MELETDFATFLAEIRPTTNQRLDLQTGHQTLRERLRADDTLRSILVSDFLQGSYKRSTAVRPRNDKCSDVDIVVVTKLSEGEYTPEVALNLFEPFLNEHYKGKWRRQGRSFGIELSYVELDLVPTSAPSEAEAGILSAAAVTSDDDVDAARDWRLHPSWVALGARAAMGVGALLKEAKAQPEWQINPLRIPDRDAQRWESTHPIEQIRWTVGKNNCTNRHFVNVVKAVKWWRLEKHEKPEHPKGFPLERLVGECCPDGIATVAEGVARTLEEIVAKYAFLALAGGKPQLPDYGVPSHDVFKRVSSEDFKKFYDQAVDAAKIARRALDEDDRTASGNLWRELLGGKFPKPPNGGGSTKKAGYTLPLAPAVPGSGRFA